MCTVVAACAIGYTKVNEVGRCPRLHLYLNHLVAHAHHLINSVKDQILKRPHHGAVEKAVSVTHLICVAAKATTLRADAKQQRRGHAVGANNLVTAVRAQVLEHIRVPVALKWDEFRRLLRAFVEGDQHPASALRPAKLVIDLALNLSALFI